MKSRSREINIFSMSALDLFASGMGAFILLAVIGLIFFPNMGDSEERVEEIKKALAQARRERDAIKSRLEESTRARRELEKRVTELQQQLKEIEIPDIDIAICLDVTGSMGDQIEGLQKQIVDLANVLDALAPSAGVGVVAFGDRAWSRYIYKQAIVETSNVGELQTFVNTLSAGMGETGNKDFPEAVALALDEAVRLNWRAVSQRRYIIVVTDNPAYPEKVGASMQTARAFASAGGQHVSTVMANTSGENARPFLTDLAAAGNGEFVNASGGESMIASLLMAILSK